MTTIDINAALKAGSEVEEENQRKAEEREKELSAFFDKPAGAYTFNVVSAEAGGSEAKGTPRIRVQLEDCLDQQQLRLDLYFSPAAMGYSMQKVQRILADQQIKATEGDLESLARLLGSSGATLDCTVKYEEYNEKFYPKVAFMNKVTLPSEAEAF